MTLPSARIAVLIPTHDHGRLIRHAVASALDQSVPVTEILIVGDGAPQATAELVAELGTADSRVRYFPFEKGPRHGEIHRHEVLRSETDADLILYLSDDDLWLPNHVETMAALLAESECAFGLAARVAPDGSAKSYVHNMGTKAWKDFVLEKHNQVPLSAFGHRMSTYRTLPHGWRTTPADCATDIFMYQQFIRARATAASSFRPTVVNFPSRPRADMSIEERNVELERWAKRRTEHRWITELQGGLLEERQRMAANERASLWRMAGQAIEREELLRAEVALLQKENGRLEKQNHSGRHALRTLRAAARRRLRPSRHR